MIHMGCPSSGMLITKLLQTVLVALVRGHGTKLKAAITITLTPM
jgi:hypothetical protein